MTSGEVSDVSIRLRVINEMGKQLGAVKADIVGLGSGSSRSLRDAQVSAASLDNTLAGMPNSGGRGLSSITASAKNMALGIAGAILTVKSLAQQFSALISEADGIAKMSDRLGASTEALSEYRHVAELSGVTFQTLTMGWQRMTRRVAEAAAGTGEAKDALIELGVEATVLNQMAPEKQFEVLTDALNGVENSADRVRLSMKLFDSEGVSLLQTMTRGSAGLREMRDEARSLGMSLSAVDAAKAEEAADAMARLNAAVTGVRQSLALLASGPIVGLLDKLSEKMADDAAFRELARLTQELKTTGPEAYKELRRWQKLYNLDVEQSLAFLRGLNTEFQMVKPAPWMTNGFGTGQFNGMKAGVEEVAAEVDALDAKVVRTFEGLSGSASRLGIALQKIDVGFNGEFVWVNKTPEDLAAEIRESFEYAWSARPIILEPVVDLKSAFIGPGVRESDRGFKEIERSGTASLSVIESGALSAGHALSSSISGAVASSKSSLLDLGSIARSVFSTLVSGFVGFGLSFLPGVGHLFEKRAAGGPTNAGQTYLVGERGPELLTMGGNGYVTPNDKLVAATVGGGQTIINLNSSFVMPASSVLFADNRLAMRRWAEEAGRIQADKISRTVRERAHA